MKKRYIALFVALVVGFVCLVGFTLLGCGTPGSTQSGPCPPGATYCPTEQAPVSFGAASVSEKRGEVHVLGKVPVATTLFLVPPGTDEQAAQSVNIPAGAWVVHELR